MKIQGHTLQEWLAATRYWSFAVSAMPVVVTATFLASACGAQNIDWLNVALSLVGVILLHSAGNLLSDVGDYRSGADCQAAFAVPNLVQHIFEPREYLCFSAFCAVLGSAIGLWLVVRCGVSLLWIGLAGVVLTAFYTLSKKFFLSDIVIFVIFGVLILAGTSVAAVGRVCSEIYWLSLPLGLITLSVLHINNTVDMATDGAAGLRTMAMAMGTALSVKVYVVYQLLPFAVVIAGVVAGVFPWAALFALEALVTAVRNVRRALSYRRTGREVLQGLDQQSAKLQLVFSSLLALGFLFSMVFFH